MIDQNKILRGNFGALWINNEEVAEVKTFEAKVTLEYAELDIMGKMGKYQRNTGFTGEGTMVLHKINSRIIKLVGEELQDGKLPEIKIVAKLADPTADGEERVVFTNVTVDELMLMKFENKELREEEVPFKFAEYEIIDSI